MANGKLLLGETHKNCIFCIYIVNLIVFARKELNIAEFSNTVFGECFEFSYKLKRADRWAALLPLNYRVYALARARAHLNAASCKVFSFTQFFIE